MIFSQTEIDYMNGQRLGRLATVGPSGQPHIVPISFRYNPETATIDLGSRPTRLIASKKWRDKRSARNVAQEARP